MLTSRRPVFMALAGVCLLTVLAVGALWIAKPQFDLWRAEQAVDELYRETRPFPFRWRGAPYAHLNASDGARSGSRSRAALLVGGLKTRLGESPRWLRLRARLSLLEGKYEQAATEFNRAQLLASAATAAAADPDLDSETAVAYALRAEAEKRASDYRLALDYAGRSIKVPKPSEVAQFNAALIFEKVYLLRSAEAQWSALASNDPNPDWKGESKAHGEAIAHRLDERAELIKHLQDPAWFADAAAAGIGTPGALEVAQQAALEDWLVSGKARSPSALAKLALETGGRHGDVWWRDFLAAPQTRATTLLSQAYRANLAGRHREAGEKGAAAELLFAGESNAAGRLRARFERIQASHRGDSPGTCTGLLQGFDKETGRRGYRWLQSQGWLDEITCRSLLRLGGSLTEREEVLERLEASPGTYEGVRLRGLSFLSGPEVVSVSQLNGWSYAAEGLRRFWTSVVPEYRLLNLCDNMADLAKALGSTEAPVILLGESVLNLGERNPGLRIMVTSDLASAEAAAGLHRDAAAHFEAAAARRADGAPLPPSECRYAVLSEIERGRAELAAGDAKGAVDRLSRLREGRGAACAAVGSNEYFSADLVTSLGAGLLRLGRYKEASERFGELIALNRNVLSSPATSPLERESVTQFWEASFRGMIESRLRSGVPAGAALTEWRAYRSATVAGEREQATPVPPPGMATLTYAYLPTGISAWIADSDGVEQHWIDSTRVTPLARQLSGLAADPESPAAAISAAAGELGKLLLGPFGARLGPPGLKTLIIDADGAITQVPWALVEDAKGNPLVTRLSLVQVCGLKREISAVAAAHRISSESKAAVFADPLLSGPGTEAFPPLMDARREGMRVGRRFPSAVLIEGAAADKEAFLKLAQSVEVLHFAGHGVVNGGYGGLMLAGKQGFLDAGQISRLDLSRLRLAVLSACSTGVGDGYAPVDADTLVRGFVDAGAERVLAASWKVDSRATAELMERFYVELLGGKSPSESLRAAILTVRAQPAFAHPSAWAAFQLYGAP